MVTGNGRFAGHAGRGIQAGCERRGRADGLMNTKRRAWLSRRGRAIQTMNELSLFTGAGGGLLGTTLLGWRCVGAVEFADYPVKILEARQNDGHLETFPIWHMDIREFNERIAPMYRGVADVVSAGFPCQPFSAAGKKLGADDPRNMWPATIECIRLVQPRFAFLENVPGLISSGYFGTILGDLAESGYDARWRVLSAAELGAPHKRDRLWIVADSTNARASRRERFAKNDAEQSCFGTFDRNGSNSNFRGENVADVNGAGLQMWATEPDVGRVAHGVAARVDRLKAIGNGQVPAVAAAAWRILSAGLMRRGRSNEKIP